MRNNIRHTAAAIIMVTMAQGAVMAQTVHRAPASGGLGVSHSSSTSASLPLDRKTDRIDATARTTSGATSAAAPTTSTSTATATNTRSAGFAIGGQTNASASTPAAQAQGSARAGIQKP